MLFYPSSAKLYYCDVFYFLLQQVLQPEIFLVRKVRKFSSSAASVVIKHFNHINKGSNKFLNPTNINTGYNLS